MNFIRKTKELLLVHTAMHRVTLTENINIMLTPQFYTTKKEVLPIKYAYQAKKIAPSLFEGLLEEGGSYEYTVSNDGDTWTFIAYDIEKIADFLASKGIGADKISKLYFAQQSVDRFTAPLALSDKESLVNIDDTVVVVPSIVLEDKGEASLAFDKNFTPKTSGVSVKTGGMTKSMFTQSQALTIAAVLALFAGMFAVEGSRYDGGNKADEETLQALYESYPSLESSYTRAGIVEKYRNINTLERKKRETIKTLSHMIFKGVTLTSAHLDEKRFNAHFSCDNEEVANRVKALAKKSHYNTSKTKNSNDLTVEGAL